MPAWQRGLSTSRTGRSQEGCARFVRCDQHGDVRDFFTEDIVNRLSIRALTWGTALGALLSAWLLALEDTALPEMARSGVQAMLP
jgi:hypothetical protein